MKMFLNHVRGIQWQKSLVPPDCVTFIYNFVLTTDLVASKIESLTWIRLVHEMYQRAYS